MIPALVVAVLLRPCPHGCPTTPEPTTVTTTEAESDTTSAATTASTVRIGPTTSVVVSVATTAAASTDLQRTPPVPWRLDPTPQRTLEPVAVPTLTVDPVATSRIHATSWTWPTAARPPVVAWAAGRQARRVEWVWIGGLAGSGVGLMWLLVRRVRVPHSTTTLPRPNREVVPAVRAADPAAENP